MENTKNKRGIFFAAILLLFGIYVVFVFDGQIGGVFIVVGLVLLRQSWKGKTIRYAFFEHDMYEGRDIYGFKGRFYKLTLKKAVLGLILSILLLFVLMFIFQFVDPKILRFFTMIGE